MESDLQQHHHFIDDHHQHHHQKHMNSGLVRYQSAPSSYFSSLLDREFCDEFLNRPTSPETERIFARFLANSSGNTDNISSQNPCPVKQDSETLVGETLTQLNQEPQIMVSVSKNDTSLHQQQVTSYPSSASQRFYPNQSRPPIPDQNSGSSYRAVTSTGMERLPQVKIGGGGNNSNLVRHSSSPAGLFSNINIEMENGYAIMRSMGDLGSGNRETSCSAASRPLTASGRMSPIAEMGNKNTGENGTDNTVFGEAHSNDYAAGFPMESWDDSAIMTDGAKGLTDDDRTLSGLNASETQNVEPGNPPPMLAHHLSLPKTSAEMSAIERFLQLQDSVPCKIRAKRGCATHPRSIAERVRRTRISERMRKLQDLVPNMDKQTNTADMLDLAVDYIKDLQRQVKTLSENRAKCMCTNKQES